MIFKASVHQSIVQSSDCRRPSLFSSRSSFGVGQHSWQWSHYNKKWVGFGLGWKKKKKRSGAWAPASRKLYFRITPIIITDFTGRWNAKSVYCTTSSCSVAAKPECCWLPDWTEFTKSGSTWRTRFDNGLCWRSSGSLQSLDWTGGLDWWTGLNYACSPVELRLET